MRLYGADCLESHVNDSSDERRLRAQRRYFGITGAEEDPGEAIALAKGFGKQAARETVSTLSDPASHLVSKGLARAFGVYRQTFDGLSHEEYRSGLSDLELQAAKMGLGIWARTNWDSLPKERAEQRHEEAEVELALDSPRLPEGTKLDPNTAARDELIKLPGIGEALANRIIEGRPYEKPEDLSRVNGIGPATLGKLEPYLEFPAGK